MQSDSTRPLDKQQPTLNFESEMRALSGDPVAGVDEAGRGPWAGPVVAAAVILDPNHLPLGLNDSKKLSEQKREQLFEEIIQMARVGVGIVSPAEIDQLNILQATMQAMTKAVQQLPAPPAAVLIDGNRCPRLNCQSRAIVKGDQRSLSIAAASIIAKVTRDRLMVELAAEYPQYGFEKHKGYGTKAHQQALTDHGVTPHHRRSFKPIQTMIARSGEPLCQEKNSTASS
jgi:ribonuclease HII